MLFNSYVFIFGFLPIVLAGFALLRRSPNLLWPIIWLVFASLLYYGWWRPEFLLLLIFSITVNLGLGKLIIQTRSSSLPSRAVLTAGIMFNLGLLGYFKYADFFVANANHLFGLHWVLPNVILPIGISFITFQKIAFLVDAYHGLVRNFTLLNYAFFVTFFPQLIAGPITHHSEIIPQIGSAPRRNLSADLAVGISIFVVGLFKKVIIADGLALYADAGYAAVKAGHSLDSASAWVTVLCYSYQLYYDFSGYSDMAVGLARMFGFELPVNFFSPYKASSVIDFWRRWHITLSRFLRDYLYIPLGGNRCGSLRRYLNLGIVMLLGGLWHGANWTFVIWGGVHGLMLALNHVWRALPLSRSLVLKTRLAERMSVLFTFTAVTLAWVLFRSETLEDAGAMFGALWQLSGEPSGWPSFLGFLRAQFTDYRSVLSVMEWFKPRELWPAVLPPSYLATSTQPMGLFLLCIAVATFTLPNTYQIFGRFKPALGLSEQTIGNGVLRRLDWRVAAIVAGMFLLSILRLSHVSPFLYYQF